MHIGRDFARGLLGPGYRSMLTVIKFICRTARGQAEGQRFSKHQRLGKHTSCDMGIVDWIHPRPDD